MRYREFCPPAFLSGHIRCVWTLSGDADPQTTPPEPIVPDGSAEIVLNLGDAFLHVQGGVENEQPLAMVVGQTTGPTLLRPGQSIRLVGIRLAPWGGFAVLGIPMAELKDAFVPVDEILPHLGTLHERLSSLPEASWAEATFRHLRNRLELKPPHPTARAMIRVIREREGRVSTNEIAKVLHLSKRTVERVARREVGLPPVVCARILRLQRAIGRVRRSTTAQLGQIAVQSGYYDQAHFCREFQSMIGLTPSELRRRERGLTEVFLESAAPPSSRL